MVKSKIFVKNCKEGINLAMSSRPPEPIEPPQRKVNGRVIIKRKAQNEKAL